MRPWIRRTLVAAVLAVCGGAASAQAPQPLPMPPSGLPGVGAPAVPVRVAQQPEAKGGLTPVPTTPPAAAPSHFGPAPAATVPGAGGCAAPCAPAAAPCAPDCGSPLLGKSRAGRILGVPFIGRGCANPVGCGNLASERTFLFGGCKQFFNPGNKCGLGGAGCREGCGPCVYGSYLNR